MSERDPADNATVPSKAPREAETAGGTRAETPSLLPPTGDPISACEELIRRVRRHSPDCLSDLASGLAETDKETDESSRFSAVSVPSHVGRFEIEQLIGQGGFGIVYRARDPKLGRHVAVKVPRLATLATEVDRLRFVQEAKTLSALDHPQIATMFEAGCDGPVSFSASELCSGGSLAALLEANGPLTPALAARIVQRLAEAVHHAHARGVIHRDLKPSNILFSEPVSATTELETLADRLRISDFGLARFVDADGGLTRSVAFLGTPAYMSPEQADGDPTRIGTYSDVYALGAILYELLTGAPPFRGSSTLATLDAVRHQSPAPIRSVAPGVPRDLEAICLKCLEKDPRHRYDTAANLADDLGAFLEGSPVRARHASLPRRLWQYGRRNRAATALIAALVVLAVGGPLATLWINAERLRAEVGRRTAEKQRLRAERADEESRKRLDQAIAAIDEMITQLQHLGWTPRSQKARRALLARVGRLTEELAGDDDDARIESLRRRVLVQRAKLEVEFGAAESAREFSRQAVAAARRLVARFPDQDEYQIGLADALHALAITENKNHRIDAAIAAGRQALEAYGNVRHPNRVVQAVRWRSYGDLAAWLMARRSFREAESTVRDGLRRCAAEGVAPHGDGTRAEAFAYLSYRLGECLTRQKRFEEAFKHLDTAGTIWEKQWTSDAIDAARYVRLAGDCAREVTRNRSLKELPQWLDGVLRELDRYHQTDPSDTRMAQTLAALNNQLGLRHREREQFERAERCHRRAIEIYLGLTADRPESILCRRELGGAWNNLALAQLKQNQPGPAWESIRQAIAVQQRLLDDEPRDTTVRHYLANHFTVAVQARLLLGDPIQAVSFAESRGELYPRSAVHQLGTAHALCRLAAVVETRNGDNAGEIAARIQDRAVAVLAGAVKAGLTDAAALAADSRFASLAGHTGFQAIIFGSHRESRDEAAR